jgi:hypothetical protein
MTITDGNRTPIRKFYVRKSLHGRCAGCKKKMKRTKSLKQIALLGAILALTLAIAGCHAKTAAETQALVDAKALLSFHDRLVTYIAVHKQAKAQLGFDGIKVTNDPAQIVQRQQAIAERIGMLRRQANEGELFTPEIRTYFARALDSAYLTNPQGISTSLECIPTLVEEKIKPNDVYPDVVGYSIVPPTMLLHIPELPAELEYRIVNKDLLIRDIEGNMIVDVMRNAITFAGGGAKCGE